MSENRIAWMIERNSVLWGHEWFCAGINRWTKDPNKTIQFPDEASAKEVWLRLSGEKDENKEFPYTEEGAGDWQYTMSITEHAWMPRFDADPLSDFRKKLAEKLDEMEERSQDYLSSWELAVKEIRQFVEEQGK